MMNSEEAYLREKIGQENPFRVPDGYFEQLAGQVMSQLPELSGNSRQKARSKSRLVALRPWFLAAAASVVAVVVMSVSLHFAGAPQEEPVAAAASPESGSYMDEVADYAMYDNTEIYAYLSEN